MSDGNSSGYILLEGGAEFGGQMEQPDRVALRLAGEDDIRVAIIPAAAAPDHNHLRAGENGVRWFRNLGAKNVVSLPLIDRQSADRPDVVEALARARLIYLLGGFPSHLADSLRGSRSWEAILAAHRHGAVVGGSSAGAMVLCSHFYDPYDGVLAEGLHLLANACVIPHHNRSGKSWVPQLQAQLPKVVLVGIDEQTGMIDDAGDGKWSVYGKGAVTIYHQDIIETYCEYQSFSLNT
jgi:cyanophycinase